MINDMKRMDVKEWLYGLSDGGKMILDGIDNIVIKMIYNESIQNYEKCAEIQKEFEKTLSEIDTFEFWEYDFNQNERDEMKKYVKTIYDEMIINKRNSYMLQK